MLVCYGSISITIRADTSFKGAYYHCYLTRLDSQHYWPSKNCHSEPMMEANLQRTVRKTMDYRLQDRLKSEHVSAVAQSFNGKNCGSYQF